jgi:hypothetical protein
MMKRNALWALLAVGMTVVSTGVVNAQWLLPKMGLIVVRNWFLIPRTIWYMDPKFFCDTTWVP